MATKQRFIHERRQGSIKRMEKQLESGVRTLSAKTAKRYGKGKKKGDVVPLTEVDRKRIKLCIEQTKAKTRGVSK